ncbi:cytochrome P450 [Nocardiopsis sp. CNT-189]|uniref:cytochrome P450 n=1 Tax=Nocardiopsis oceanisediminis TaxID=2816862 RepID=UPI003B2F4BE3
MTALLPHTAPQAPVDPFAPGERGIAEPHPARAALRAAGPIVQAEAPAGGPAWIVTDGALARRVLRHPHIVKDPARAPAHWDRRTAGLEPTAAEQPSLTTLDGPPHTRLRRAHTPLFGADREAAWEERITELAREMLTGLAAAGGTVDLAADFTTRFPLTVVCDLIGVPPDRIDEAIAACRGMHADDPAEAAAAMEAFNGLAAAALDGDRGGFAAELRETVRGTGAEADLRYLLFTLIFAGQLTTDPSMGYLIAHLLADAPDGPAAGSTAEEAAAEVLNRHAPAPFSLWRFTDREVELAGVRLPAGAPVLVDILGINTGPGARVGADLAFGAGPHYCTGARLARAELVALARVLRTELPGARLAVPFTELRQTDFGGIRGSRLTALPVRLRG